MGFVTRGRLEDMLDLGAPERACRRIADDVGDALETATKRKTPIDKSFAPGRPRGTARESVHRTKVEKTFVAASVAFRVRVRTEDPLFPYIEWTTRPHIIRPRADREAATVIETGKPRGTQKDGRASLSWRGPGGRVFAKVVHHPGTKGQHPFSLAALQVSGELRGIAVPALREFERDLVRSRKL